MKLNRVLVVFKKSTLQLQAFEHKEPRFLKLLEEGHASVAKVKTAHEQHVETLVKIEKCLTDRNISFEKVARAEKDSVTAEFDMLISVGGDGTFLDASHATRTLPILGVNSALSSSFGHFCLANGNNFAEVIDKIISDELKPQRLLRLELILNGVALPELVLNEVLIAHTNPAGTSRYLIDIDGAREEQRSSGIFVGPPPGATGSIRSAGGQILPITLHEYQYIVREPWMKPGQAFKFPRGILKRNQSMFIISQMRTGALYIDGSHIVYQFPLGDELTIRAADEDLVAFVNPAVNDIFLDGN
ncbi:MAG: NAD(+)/NADH kinase [Candidatus Obscuribacterales bacterium]|nr:NAD(+)/NADH kinase [Candidatus Obscuribacterales bacterium]